MVKGIIFCALLIVAIWYAAMVMGIVDGGFLCRKQSLGHGQCWQVWIDGEKYKYSGNGCYTSSDGKTICYE